jgi:hypothetical protein
MCRLAKNSGSCILILTAVLALATPALSATYCIDFTAGSDANSGLAGDGTRCTSTGTAPWRYAPGMPQFTGTYRPASGDQFIFRGGTRCGAAGDSCFGTKGWVLSSSGVSGNHDYYGVDRTWYAGSSWTPPVIDGGGGLSGQIALTNGSDTVNWVSGDRFTFTAGGQYVYYSGEGVAIGATVRVGTITSATQFTTYGNTPFSGATGTYSYNVIPIGTYVNIGGGNFTLDGLQVQDVGVPGINQGNYAVNAGGDNVTVENMVIRGESRICLSTSGSNLLITGNDISECSWGVDVGAAASGIISGITISNNQIHDFHDQMADGAHADGIIVFGGSANPSAYIYNVASIGNVFHGDFSASDASSTGVTAMIFYENDVAGPMLIYNNVSYITGGGGEFAAVGNSQTLPNQNLQIYSNSVLQSATAQGFLEWGNLSTVVSENNIVVGGSVAYVERDKIATVTSDYNDFYKTSAYAEAHGLSADPLFSSTTDLRLQSGSPAVGAGLNLSGVFTTDADGSSRPTPLSGNWDMGAYQIPPAQTRPNSPTTLRVGKVQ